MYKSPGYSFLIIVALLALFAGVMESCRSTKKLEKVMAIPAAHVDTTGNAARAAALPVRDYHADSLQVIRTAVNGMVHNHIDFQTFSGHMHVHYQGGDGKDYEVNANVHIKKDSIIWMSVYANVGPVVIEVFRVLITPDSVKIIDKRAKIIRMRSVSYLREQVHLPVDFRTLQDMLIGNPIFLDTAHVLYYRSENRGLSLFSVGTVFTNFMTLNSDNTPRHSKLDDTDPLQARTCDLTYGDYDYSGPVPFSTYRKISVAEKSKVDIEIGIKPYKFNEALSYAFSIPKNYKRR